MPSFDDLITQLPRAQSFETFILSNWVYVEKRDLIYNLA